jgi:acyl-CoA thioester hydrolase
VSGEPGLPFTHALRVRYGECDPQGIVFNANYLLYMDVGFTELWRVAVGPWQEMVERGVDAVLAEANISFRRPARFDDELTLAVSVERLGETAISTVIDVLRGDEMLVRGGLRHVCVRTRPGDGGTGLPDQVIKTPIPDWVRAGLARYLAPDAAARART